MNLILMNRMRFFNGNALWTTVIDDRTLRKRGGMEKGRGRQKEMTRSHATRRTFELSDFC